MESCESRTDRFCEPTQRVELYPRPDNGFNGEYAGFTFTTQYNGGSAVIQGLELNYSQQFTFLPGIWKGLGAYANVGISYIKDRINLRFQVNHRGRYLSTYNANQSRLQYTMPRTTLDIKTVYQISRHFDCYLDILNVLNEPDMRVEYYGGRPGAQHIMSPQLLFGISARL